MFSLLIKVMIKSLVFFNESISESKRLFIRLLLPDDIEINVYIGKRSHKDEEESRYKHEWFRKHVYWFECIVHLRKTVPYILSSFIAYYQKNEFGSS